jgi:uncharacterized RDD family membrane protein YckC
MLTREARAAARAAEAASIAAQEAHAAAQSVLASLEGASAAEADWVRNSAAENFAPIEAAGYPAESSREANRPILVQGAPAIVEVVPEDHHGVPLSSAAQVNHGGLPGAGEAEPIYANLIHFPREVVATRKLRPRRAEGPLTDPSAGAQLSIFEVDPDSISTEPAAEQAAPGWLHEKWAERQLEAQPQPSILEQAEPAAAVQSAVNPASLSWRVLASVVDITLVVGLFVGAVALASSHLRAPLSLRAFEIVSVVSLLMIGAMYETLFLTLAKTTPGMKYAGIALCTLDGDRPDRSRCKQRLVAMLLSVLPLGLGLVWALVDNDLLTWHDRLSGTYLRKL